MVLRKTLPSAVLALTLLTQPGCRAVGYVFKAGVFAGVLAFLLCLAVIAGVAHMIRHRARPD